MAFTILVMLLGALLEVFGSGLRAAAAGQWHTRAVLIAQSKLAELADGEPLADRVRSGEEDRFQWQITMTPYVDAEQPQSDVRKETSAVQPWEVTVDVSWHDGNGSGSVTLASLILERIP